MHKKIISLILILSIFINSSFFYIPLANAGAEHCVGVSCGYLSDCLTCVDANKSGTARGITDFICIETPSDAKILAQIILDKKFRELDKEILEYIEDLDQGKTFGLDKLDEVVANFSTYGFYRKKYEKICKQSILEDFMNCSGKMSIDDAKDFLGGENGANCMDLVDIKIGAYRMILYGILKLNKLEVRKEARKTYNRTQRERITKILNMMGVILVYFERIWKAWQTKTTHPYGLE